MRSRKPNVCGAGSASRCSPWSMPPRAAFALVRARPPATALAS
ncbi:MAG: hypothetical protein WDN72_01005 [Alphaproteobacteria bacterium]